MVSARWKGRVETRIVAFSSWSDGLQFRHRRRRRGLQIEGDGADARALKPFSGNTKSTSHLVSNIPQFFWKSTRFFSLALKHFSIVPPRGTSKGTSKVTRRSSSIATVLSRAPKGPPVIDLIEGSQDISASLGESITPSGGTLSATQAERIPATQTPQSKARLAQETIAFAPQTASTMTDDQQNVLTQLFPRIPPDQLQAALQEIIQLQLARSPASSIMASISASTRTLISPEPVADVPALTRTEEQPSNIDKDKQPEEATKEQIPQPTIVAIQFAPKDIIIVSETSTGAPPESK
ncbi:hypothetical protein NL676_008250 [Syzygium grande]|nr:hypothetical protein NL676_008250 [Syzygium grande]